MRNRYRREVLPHFSVSILAVSPFFDDVIREGTVWVVIWSGPARLHKELDLRESRMGCNAHVEHIHQIYLQRIQTWIHWTAEVIVSKNVKWVTKSAKSGFSEDEVWLLVDVVVWNTSYFGVLAGEADFNLIASGDYFIGIFKRIDLVFKDHEVSGVLIGYEEAGVWKDQAKKKEEKKKR